MVKKKKKPAEERRWKGAIQNAQGAWRRDEGASVSVADKSSTQQNNAEEKTPTKPPRLSKNGMVIRVGAIITDSNGISGRVTHIAGNVVVYRIFPGQDISEEETYSADFSHEAITVLLDYDDVQCPAMPGVSSKWMQLALEIARILDQLELADSAGELEPLSSVDKKETLEGMETAFWNIWSNLLGNEVRTFNSPGVSNEA
jgi:hypothetical protein